MKIPPISPYSDGNIIEFIKSANKEQIIEDASSSPSANQIVENEEETKDQDSFSDS